MHRKFIAAGALVALAVPAGAQAHVTVQPNTAAAGGYTVENIRVPNEEDKATTTKIEVQFPDGFAGVSYQKVPGWTVKVKTKKLATPIETDDGPITEGVDTVTFSGGSIPPGAFQDFPLSVKIPDGKEGSKLVFKAVQTYDNGEVVSWIGAEDSEHPAPAVTLTAARDDHHATAAEPAAAAATKTVVKEKTNNTGKTLAIVALALAAVALAAGLRPKKG